MTEDDVRELLRKHWYRCEPEDIPAEVRPQAIEMLKESAALSARIQHLGDLLAAGQNTVRAELNPAIRRNAELGKKLHQLMQGLGLVNELPVMYGPPSSFRRDE